MAVERVFTDRNKDKSVLKEKRRERKNSQGGKRENLPVNMCHRQILVKLANPQTFCSTLSPGKWLIYSTAI